MRDFFPQFHLTFKAPPCNKVAKLGLVDLVWIKAVLSLSRVKLHLPPALNYPPLAQSIARTELLQTFVIFDKTFETRDTLGKLAAAGTRCLLEINLFPISTKT